MNSYSSAELVQSHIISNTNIDFFLNIANVFVGLSLLTPPTLIGLTCQSVEYAIVFEDIMSFNLFSLHFSSIGFNLIALKY